MKILMVCLGNICRSPMAEGIMKHKIKTLGYQWTIDSAGTSGYHDGEHPDTRAIKECAKHGIDISSQISRKLMKTDFEHYDYILAMDQNNYADILDVCPNSAYKDKVKLAMSFGNISNIVVPDPYFDGKFSLVYELLDECLDQFIEQNQTINVGAR